MAYREVHFLLAGVSLQRGYETASSSEGKGVLSLESSFSFSMFNILIPAFSSDR